MLNVLLLGVGQCGNRILDAVNREAFASSSKLSKYYSRQKFPTRVETLAINTAINDLKELRHTLAKDRIHVPNLHGVGANRNIGKKGFYEHRDLIMQTIEARGDFDLVFAITSAAGGTGSSFTPLMINELKERYDVPIIAIIVLPFREEGTIFLQNAAFCLKEMAESKIDGTLFVDNQYLKRFGGDIYSAYDKINNMTAERLLFLIESLDSEMLAVTDLGDFKTVMSGGLSIGTMGFYKADKNTSVKSAIQGCLKPSGLLFPANVYEEAARAMIIIQGSKEYLNVEDITKEVEKLSADIGQVFKGIIIKRGTPKVLSVFTLESVPELEKLYAIAAEAIQSEKEKREKAKKKLDDAFSL
ncbi:MAG: cell division protein FtsZ, partial [Methanosarcinales archaeon]